MVGRIEEKIELIAQVLKSDGSQEISLADWKTLCIIGRIGYDARTHKAVLSIALAEGMVKPKRGQVKGIYVVNQGRVSELLNNGSDE